VVRFEEDGPLRRVEILLHAPRSRNIVATGTGKAFTAALTAALARMEERTSRVKGVPKTRRRRLLRPAP
jgi:ribosome-associated translation inhibitor RaiA